MFCGYCCDVASITPVLMPFVIASQPPSTETIRTSSWSLPAALSARGAAEAGRLVDRVDDVDARVLLQQLLHRRLTLGAVAQGVGRADDLRVAVLDPEALEEAVVAELADRDARAPGRASRSSA